MRQGVPRQRPGAGRGRELRAAPALSAVRPGADLIRLALEQAGHVRFRARGTSMRPFLCDGDVVSVARLDPECIVVGDVVCYDAEGGRRVAVHRVVRRVTGHVVTKGDALDWAERVPLGRILGRVTAVERRGRLGRIVTRLVRLCRRLGRVGHVGHA